MSMTQQHKPKQKINLRMSLFALMLVVTLVAVGFGYFVNQREIEFIQSKLPALREVARELVVEDPSRAHAVKQYPEWFGQKLWKIYLPSNSDFQLCVATAEIDSTGFPPTERSIPIDSGIHNVSFCFSDKEVGEDFIVAIDDTLAQKVPIPWDSKRIDSFPWLDGLDFTFDVNQEKRVGQKLELLRFRCNQERKAATKPGAGFLVWIQQAK